MRNLSTQLTLGVLAVLAVVLAVGGTLIARDVERSNRQSIDDRLRRTAELTRVNAVRIVQEGLPDSADRQLDNVLRATASSLRVLVGGQVAVQSGLPLPASLAPRLGFSTATVRGRSTRILATSLKDPSLDGVARQEVATSLRETERRQRTLEERMLAAGAAMLAVAALGVLAATGRVLAPLRRLRTAAAGIASDDDLQQRVPVQGPAELQGMASSFNEMLERLSRAARERRTALEATRRFAADAGHELRTPLTSVQASLSIIARHPEMDDGQRTQLAQDALDEQRRLVHLLDGLQALARGDANPVRHAPVDLVEVADAAVQAARTRHPAVTWQAALPEPRAALHTVQGWEPGLRLLVDNVLENAARHGRPSGTVRLTVQTDGGQLTLLVEDDGPGVPEADRERIFMPFARAADVDRPGSGLGLALVAQQAGHHAAHVTVDGSPALGGARFTVRYSSTATSRPANVASASGE